MTTVNPDIAKERLTATFDVEQMTYLLDGDPNVTKRRREVQARAQLDTLFSGGEEYSFLSRDEQYSRAVQKSIRFWQIARECGYLNIQDTNNFWRVAFPSEGVPFDLHLGMFVDTLQSQCTDEQREKWLPLALQGKILGTYAQTELGHGTFLRGLETTATFDPPTDQFIIHTPTLTATKWWPGGLGKTSNCCILMAKLVIKGKAYGMHMFFVQFRNFENHLPLPGVTVGDIGPKMDFASLDNGFLRFDNFRIPRENMLMKHVKVLRDGTYMRHSSQKKPMYGVMMLARVQIVSETAKALAMAVTIATRYSAIRRQSELKPGAPEPQILDYQTQQYKLFPYLVMAYGFNFAAADLKALYDQAIAMLDKDDDIMIPETHALSSALKALCSRHMNLGIEQCRVSCGGHGYSQASGLPKLYGCYTPASTYEGENTVLLLQTARYLLRCLDLTKTKKRLPDTVSFLGQRSMPRSSLNENVSLDHLLDLFQYRARLLAERMARRLSELRADGLEEWAARNDAGVEMIRAAEAYGSAFVTRSFCDKAKTTYEPSLAKVITQMCQLLACYWIEENAGDYLEDEYLDAQQITIIQDKQMFLLAELRPNVITLVDAFDFPDAALSSILGRYDGNVYENMYQWAIKSPLNKTQVHDSYHKYLKPMMSVSKL